MRIGKLDQRLTIQSYTTAKNASGEDVLTWADIITVWCGIEFKGGDEDFEAEQKVSTEVVEFTIRFRALTENNRIVYDSIKYDILSIEGNYRERYLKVKAKKRNNG